MKFVLAPLAGFTDAPFRRLCHEGGADLAYTEMVSAAAAETSRLRKSAIVRILFMSFSFQFARNGSFHHASALFTVLSRKLLCPSIIATSFFVGLLII